MKTYFFGDIHGNLPALEACLKHAASQNPDAVFAWETLPDGFRSGTGRFRE